MTRPCPVGRCHSVIADDRNVCSACAADLQQHLAEMPALAVELDRTLARVRGGAVTGSGGTEAPLAYDLGASEALGLLRAVLVGWTRVLEEDPARQPVDTIAAISAWLLARLPLLLAHPAAVEICTEIAEAYGRGSRATDIHPERVFLGRCECDADLFAPLDATVVRCPACHLLHDPRLLRDGLTAKLAAALVTGAEFSGYAVRYLGVRAGQEERLQARIRTWATRGRITACGHVPAARGGELQPVYRFGDLETRLAGRPEREERSA